MNDNKGIFINRLVNKMNKIQFDSNDYISSTSLREGYIYLFKDGRCSLYLGTNSQNKYTFYVIMNVKIIGLGRDNGWKYGILHEELMLKMLAEATKEELSSQFNEFALEELATMPKIHLELSNNPINYKNWLSKNLLMGKLPKHLGIFINNSGNSDEHIDSKYKYVGAKELEVGRLYVTNKTQLGLRGEGWRCTYLYLGKDTDGLQVWAFVGCTSDIEKLTTMEQVNNHVFTYLRHGNIEKIKYKRVYRPVYYKKCAELKINVNKII